MERWNSLPFLVRQIILGGVAFTIGAVLSFAYSYRPLYGALTWKVDSLEARLDERNFENSKLNDQVAKLRSEESTRVEPETFAQVETELERTKGALAKAEKKVASTDRKRREANKSADRWRKRYESIRDEPTAAPVLKNAAPAAPTPAAVAPENSLPTTRAAPTPTIKQTADPSVRRRQPDPILRRG